MVQMKLAGYLRVSTDLQAERGYGLEIQERAIREWARANHHRKVTFFTDAGVSGSNGVENRKALPDALEHLASGRAAGLVVYRLDRLARDLVLQEQLLMEVRRLGAQVFSTAASEQDFLRDDPDDPSRRMIRQILGAVNEYERSMIRLRLRRGQQRKAENGGYAGGRPPYGYAAGGGHLLPVPAEQEVIARAAQLRREGASLRAICQTLETEGRSPRSGRQWHPIQVSRILDERADARSARSRRRQNPGRGKSVPPLSVNR
jgi:DNA invertase Pin-like site-specific DNA recombinase